MCIVFVFYPVQFVPYSLCPCIVACCCVAEVSGAPCTESITSIIVGTLNVRLRMHSQYCSTVHVRTFQSHLEMSNRNVGGVWNASHYANYTHVDKCTCCIHTFMAQGIETRKHVAYFEAHTRHFVACNSYEQLNLIYCN